MDGKLNFKRQFCGASPVRAVRARIVGRGVLIAVNLNVLNTTPRIE